ncbi:endoribonuclease ZC3H12A [Dunckerocampus dactyliophorus]|uniref:endoribonuclease ZC3H12A n=1 Tax=Dunckerocampus dactyliophorus TaxID=161453 RepID=UPI0024057A9F|nr:endoribonuclease ZC3H12A [Dunckerocampus dactyliophorus]
MSTSAGRGVGGGGRRFTVLSRSPGLFIHTRNKKRKEAKLRRTATDSEDLQLRVDFFHKLGYSSRDIKLDVYTDTNSVLEEPVQIRSVAPGSTSSGGEERSSDKEENFLGPGQRFGPLRMTPGKAGGDPELRPVVIDGSNVAMSHGNREVFSCRGIQLAVNFFLKRGHTAIKVFVPSWRKEQSRPDAPITDKHILTELEKQQVVVFTPSRRVRGKRVVCSDNRFIVRLACESGGVIVSNDTYCDLQRETPEWKKCIEERLLMYSFVNDKFMPPDDPLGRYGPSLDNFLRTKPLPTEQKKQVCPYDKKCTYGMKCKFYHPERANQSNQSLADKRRKKAQISPVNDEIASHTASQSNADHHPQELYMEPKFDQQRSSHLAGVTENKILYRGGPGNGPNHIPSNKGSSGLPFIPNHYPASYSFEFLDSGLGSYESQYSDVSNSHRPTQSCRCYSHPRTMDSAGQFLFPAQNHSLPSQHPYSEAPHCQQNYSSEPFHGQPPVRRCCPLPGSVPDSFCCSCTGQQYFPWGQQHHLPAAFDLRMVAYGDRHVPTCDGCLEAGCRAPQPEGPEWDGIVDSTSHPHRYCYKLL